jgi:hypothetical protein
MQNLYHKVAITCVGIALSFAFGANKEAKAATIILTPVTSFGVPDRNSDGLGDSYYDNVPFPVATNRPNSFIEYTAFYEFNIANLSLPSDTVISSATFQVAVLPPNASYPSFGLELFGYIGNGQPDISDFEAAPYRKKLVYLNLGFRSQNSFFDLDFSVAPFVKDLINKNDAFVGFMFRAANSEGFVNLHPRDTSLTITTEPVPEPTTIFGSAIGLCLGGWLKRRKAALQNKTTSQN